jgi:hypothetical protein
VCLVPGGCGKVTHIYDVLAPILGISNAIALLLLAVFLLFGPTRRFWVVLVYVSWELLATAGLTLFDLQFNGTAQVDHASQTLANRVYADLYWTNDVIVDLLRFVLVVVLIYKVVGSSKPLLGRVLTGLVLAMMVLPFLLFHPFLQPPRPPLTSTIPLLKYGAVIFQVYPRGAWFNSGSQLLNFGAAIMNVILWAALFQAKKRDPQILALSIGMGILVTGTAVSYGLRHFSPTGEFTAVFNLFLNLTQLTAWLIWCRAFWPVPRPKVPGNAVLTP